MCQPASTVHACMPASHELRARACLVSRVGTNICFAYYYDLHKCCHFHFCTLSECATLWHVCDCARGLRLRNANAWLQPTRQRDSLCGVPFATTRQLTRHANADAPPHHATSRRRRRPTPHTNDELLATGVNSICIDRVHESRTRAMPERVRSPVHTI